jgi:hypothetical protein
VYSLQQVISGMSLEFFNIGCPALTRKLADDLCIALLTEISGCSGCLSVKMAEEGGIPEANHWFTAEDLFAIYKAEQHKRQERRLAMAMGAHHRLGADSLVPKMQDALCSIFNCVDKVVLTRFR